MLSPFGCSTPRQIRDNLQSKEGIPVFGRPGSDLLSQVLRHSTIGAEAFNGRVRDGIGFRRLAKATRPAKDRELRSNDFDYWLSTTFAACFS